SVRRGGHEARAAPATSTSSFLNEIPGSIFNLNRRSSFVYRGLAFGIAGPQCTFEEWDFRLQVFIHRLNCSSSNGRAVFLRPENIEAPAHFTPLVLVRLGAVRTRCLTR